MAKKKVSENPKAVESRERKANSKKESQVQEKSKAEDEFWQEAGEGAKSKASKKKDEQAKQREDAAAKKAEAKRLAAEEDAAMANLAKKTPKKTEPKAIIYGLRQRWSLLWQTTAAWGLNNPCPSGHFSPAATTARSRQEVIGGSCRGSC